MKPRSASASTVVDTTHSETRPFADVWKVFQTRAWENQLTAIAGSEDVDLSCSGVDLGEANEDVYHRFVNRLEKSGEHCKTAYINGHIFITELPLQPHEYVKETLAGFLHTYVTQQATLLGLPEYRVLRVVGSVDYTADGTHKQAAQGVKPYRGPGDTDLPTFVIEIGWAETLNALDDDAQLWLADEGTAVKCVLIIKIWRLRKDDTFAALAAFYQREGAVLRNAAHQKPGIRPAWVTSFGTATPISNAVAADWLGYEDMDGYLGVPGTECTAANPIPKTIPAALLYDIIPDGAGRDLTFGLYTLQVAAFDGMLDLRAHKLLHEVLADN